jgi:protein-S-isoprenylcysteine O-methyltransferase Ste14
MWLRHLLAIVVLPFTVTVLIPMWIARRSDATFTLGTNFLDLTLQLAGVAALAVGLTLFTASLCHFAVNGRGTLAPWDPPRQLVIAGPYRFVRNPMISGVLFILVAEALLLLSWPHFEWMLTFLLINMIYIPLFEEPQLEARFGGAYREYKRQVPRVIPRWRPLG